MQNGGNKRLWGLLVTPIRVLSSKQRNGTIKRKPKYKVLLVAATVALLLTASVQTAQAKPQARFTVYQMNNAQLYKESQREIARGGIYSEAWGGASTYLKTICYEMVRRAFSRYGTQEWARYVVNRESGCNPGAVNQTYSSWSQRARGIAQLIPGIHRWVDYNRYRNDLRYAVAVFVKLSNGGRNTGPWSCC